MCSSYPFKKLCQIYIVIAKFESFLNEISYSLKKFKNRMHYEKSIKNIGFMSETSDSIKHFYVWWVFIVYQEVY